MIKQGLRFSPVFAGFSAFLIGFFITSATIAAPVTVQVQLNSYSGHEAYFSLYLVNPQGRYVKTLWISGKEQKYHKDLARWWRYAYRSNEDLDGITGASTKAGGRNMIQIVLDDSQLNAGYSLVVETAVENQLNVPADASIALSDEMKGKKALGKQYVQFIRYKW